MVNLEKYKNDGWGLSRKCFEDIILILKTFNNVPINVVEFGSGISTVFLVDLIGEGFDLHIVSYDDNPKYATKIIHPNLKLYMADLIECHDSDFNNLFRQRQFNRNSFYKKISEVHTRQKNTFYDVKDGELPKTIDLMIVDGPHGNGRSIAFLHGIGRLHKDSYVVIDDYNHYDFIDKFQLLFKTQLIFESTTGNTNQWELGGNYMIYKII